MRSRGYRAPRTARRSGRRASPNTIATVISSPWLLLAIGAAAASALMVVLWLVQVRIGDATHVDVGWAYGVGGLAVLDAAARGRQHGAPSARRRSWPAPGASGSARTWSSTASWESPRTGATASCAAAGRRTSNAASSSSSRPRRGS